MENKNRKARVYGQWATGFVALFLLLLSPCFVPHAVYAEQRKPANVPTVITARSLAADNKAHTALFEGDVVARKGDMTQYADKMLVTYSEEKGAGNIKQIDSAGNVKLIKGGRVVTSKFATYYAEPEEHIVFTGEPKASEGENVVIGTKMTYFMKDDRSVVENSKVFLTERKSGSAEARK